MTQSDDGARLVAQYRKAIEPSSDRLAAILRDVSDPQAKPRILEPRRRRELAPPAPRRGGLRLVMGGGLVALAAAAAVAWWLASTSRHATAVAEDSASQAPFGVEARGGERAVAPPTQPRTRTAEPRPDPAVVTAPGVDPPADAPAREITADVGSSRSRTRASKPSPLAEETALVERAEVLLRKNDVEGALAVLAEHARKFPSGALAVERAALRVIALCRQGNAMQGRGEAALLERHAASKPYRERIRRACADE